MSIHLFVFTAKKSNRKYLVKKPKSEVLQRILQWLQQQRDNQVLDESLLDGCTYHSSCTKKVSLNITYAKKRVASSAKEEVTDASPVKKPLTRSEVCSFNLLLCVVCQEEITERLHQAKSDACNNQLKHGFQTAPKSLAAVRVQLGGVMKNRSTLHQHLNKAHQTIQRSRVIQLVATFDKLGLSMAKKDDKRLFNIATGKLFPEHIHKLLPSVTATYVQLLSAFWTERFSTDSRTSLFSPIKKVSTPVFKNCQKKEKLEIN